MQLLFHIFLFIGAQVVHIGAKFFMKLHSDFKM